MLYAIQMSEATEPHYYLLPACFDIGGGHSFSHKNMPSQARKFTSAGDAALCCASLPFACEVVPLPGTGREYEPAPVPDRRPDVPTAGAARPFSPLGGNGKAAAPAGTVAVINGEAR